MQPRMINVEPLLFLQSFGFGLYSTVYTAFITFKHCLWLLDSTVDPSPNAHEYCMQLGSTQSTNGRASNSSHGLLRSIWNTSSSFRAFESDDDDDPDLAFLNKVQTAAAQYMIYYQVVSTVPTVLMTIFIGAWSDAHGRKPPIVIALAGSAIAIQVAIVTAAVDWLPVYIMLAPAFIKGFTGQMLVIQGGTYAMISDTASTSDRLTIRIAIASGVSSVGSLSAHLIAALILQRWDNYTVIFMCTGVCTFLSFAYAVFGLRETIGYSKRGRRTYERTPTTAQPDDTQSERNPNDEPDADKLILPINDSDAERFCSRSRAGSNGSGFPACEVPYENFDPTVQIPSSGVEVPVGLPSALGFDPEEANDGQSAPELEPPPPPPPAPGTLRSFLHIDRIKESLHILTKARPGRRRLYLLITLVSFSILFSTQANGVLNLFAKRPPLSFTNSQYSLLTSAGSCMMFAPVIFTRLLKTTDIGLIVIGLVFGVFKMAMTAFSSQQWMLFTALGIGGLSNLEFTGFRSFMTKLVETTETGRLFSTVGAIDHLTPLLSSAVFNNLYAYSLGWFPGFVFLISACFTFLVLVVMSFVYFDMKRHKSWTGEEEDTQVLIHSENDDGSN